MSNTWEPIKKIKDKSKKLHTTTENILREELQKCTLYILSELEFFKEGVFQGDSALRIVYQNYRFSEDLDFVFQSKDCNEFRSIEQKVVKIPRELRKWFPFLDIDTGKWQKRTKILNRYQFKTVSATLHSTILLQLEFANIISYQNKLTTIQYEMYTFPIRVETEEEILIDKVIAFGLRDYLKGRDLWDIYYLVVLRKIIINSDIITIMIHKKALEYGFSTDSFYNKFTQNLELLKKEGVLILNIEMKRFMDNCLYDSYSPGFNEIIHHVVHYLENIESQIKNEQ